jgi:hypothetical protein
MTTPPDSGGRMTLAEIGRVLDRSEVQRREEMVELRGEIRQLRQDMGALAFVPVAVYDVEKRALDKDIAEMNQALLNAITDLRAENTRTDGRISNAYRIAVVSLLVPILAAIIGAIVLGAVKP